MSRNSFRTSTGRSVTAVTADEMRDVDRDAVEDVGLQLLQMMENAGRILAWHVRDVRESDVVVVAGNGGNGGGGLTCARHLANRDVPVRVVLDRPSEELSGAAAHQYHILDEMGVSVTSGVESLADVAERTTIVDALIGYGLSGDVRPPADAYIDRMNGLSGPTVSLDVPSGIDATSGEPLGEAVSPARTVTLALPKTGLDALAGKLYLADISIPRTVYERLGIEYEPPFGDDDWIRLEQ
ncbi:NAD(P)H-hydrate epimerase [Halapricum hydrolyticum]|uniref:NAD(P)H-hydrate epimerase n=1 Tax=Halapricum hydrolyticum TaxID=2979991 RepID=A0AAE3IBX5_9EURY|nr:NAD(P)H-hydrate epimerase [Halapricum hydrolyticum]MCU4718100.1 NAD(P)H-hydrate epimerase [Halapricum hydrolyticum]MCU4727392.1 NAD(P)H-hydrate epimerase [Halapricum hydrolyticum]